ncbi:MAG: TrbI/VirB10 family protein [Chakrabartia sp.]
MTGVNNLGEDIGGEGDSDIRPLVGRDAGNRPLWIAIAIVALFGIMLFTMLETRRQANTAPAVRARASEMGLVQSSAPPPLYIPTLPLPDAPASSTLDDKISPNTNRTTLPMPARPSPVNPMPYPEPTSLAPFLPSNASAKISVDGSPAVVFDATGSDIENAVSSGQSATAGAPGIMATARRGRASRLINRETVVPQGTLIAAVLETALDSTQPGQARALVSTDVVSLHGGRILIPRGSRLFGEYRSDLGSGQNRMLVQWTRLVRPDGVTIAIESPAADRLGRAGIRGKVNTHFIERLGGALLQSAIDVGTIAASRAINDSTLLVTVPGTVQGSASQLVGSPPKPTLKIRQGTRISVFVNRDLDFTAVEGRK